MIMHGIHNISIICCFYIMLRATYVTGYYRRTDIFPINVDRNAEPCCVIYRRYLAATELVYVTVP